MDPLDLFAWIVLGVIVVAGLVLFFVLAALPGRIARKRGHPQAEAVAVAGWLGALLFGVLWPLALVWAFVRAPAGDGETDAALSGRQREGAP